jgi:hypothetical protein
LENVRTIKINRMKKIKYKICCYCLILFSFCCNSHSNNNNTAPDSSKTITSAADSASVKGSYAYDAEFLKKYTKKVIELQDEKGNAKVLLSADYQGRVMTTTATGDSGMAFGWINYDLISSGEEKKQFNPVGGEERFWIGPEGGQYSIYFQPGDSFTIKNWQVPPVIDTATYDVLRADKSQVVFTKKASLRNYSGTIFDIKIERKISLLNKDQLAAKLNISIPDSIHFVGFETENRIQNTGKNDWVKEKGLLSIWLLGMFTPTPQTLVIIPFHPRSDASSFITKNYFGEIPASRLSISDSVLFFSCDGKFRSKIGLSPVIAKPIAGSFDFQKNILTIIIPEIKNDSPYVNSKWEIQKEPFKGDVINSYNDGPLADGSQLGFFYEIESSSPALELKKGETGEYRETTCHFQGDYHALRQLALQLLGVDLDKSKR